MRNTFEPRKSNIIYYVLAVICAVILGVFIEVFFKIAKRFLAIIITYWVQAILIVLGLLFMRKFFRRKERSI